VHKAIKGVEIVFHAAAYFGFPAFSSNFFGDHQKVLDVNINGTSNVLQVISIALKKNIYNIFSIGLHRQ
jgi:nucleoside-diphosphate-sugar epimerase